MEIQNLTPTELKQRIAFFGEEIKRAERQGREAKRAMDRVVIYGEGGDPVKIQARIDRAKDRHEKVVALQAEVRSRLTEIQAAERAAEKEAILSAFQKNEPPDMEMVVFLLQKMHETFENLKPSLQKVSDLRSDLQTAKFEENVLPWLPDHGDTRRWYRSGWECEVEKAAEYLAKALRSLNVEGIPSEED